MAFRPSARRGAKLTRTLLTASVATVALTFTMAIPANAAVTPDYRLFGLPVGVMG